MKTLKPITCENVSVILAVLIRGLLINDSLYPYMYRPLCICLYVL